MILYNITFAVSLEIHAEWLIWMREKQIPAIMSTGLFEKHLLLKLMDLAEEDGITYALQFFASTEENYRTYLKDQAPALRLNSNKKWGDQVLSFRTLMQIVQ